MYIHVLFCVRTFNLFCGHAEFDREDISSEEGSSIESVSRKRLTSREGVMDEATSKRSKAMESHNENERKRLLFLLCTPHFLSGCLSMCVNFNILDGEDSSLLY